MPNTNIVLVSFEVQYKITLEDGSEETTQENGVKSDRLRMIANEEQDPEIFSTIAEEEKAVILPPPPPAPLDENTGVSVWQTVSVTVVNEDEDYESHKRAVEEMYSNKKVEEKVCIDCLSFCLVRKHSLFFSFTVHHTDRKQQSH